MKFTSQAKYYTVDLCVHQGANLQSPWQMKCFLCSSQPGLTRLNCRNFPNNVVFQASESQWYGNNVSLLLSRFVWGWKRWAATIHMLIRVIKFAFESFWLNMPRVWNCFISRWNSPDAHDKFMCCFPTCLSHLHVTFVIFASWEHYQNGVSRLIFLQFCEANPLRGDATAHTQHTHNLSFEIVTYMSE